MTTTQDVPLIAEDLLLLLFDPRSGTVAGEGTLFHPLAGAVLADLALSGRITLGERWTLTGRRVSAVEADPPADPLLRDAWERVTDKPHGVQHLLAAIGPRLREPLLARLVDGGDIVRRRGRFLGLVPTTRLVDGGTGRRDGLVARVRAVLVDGVDPDPRTGALGALLSASGNLPALHADFPWSGALHDRGKELERGNWGAAAAGEAVTRTVAAAVASSIAVATVVAPGR
jgi:Golgi phosphoprotein 3 (GPP34)